MASMFVNADQCLPEPTRHGPDGPLKRVLLGSGVLPGITQIAVGTCSQGQRVELHRHPSMYEIYFILEGEGWYTVGEDTRLASAGDLIIVPPDVPHAVEVAAAPHRMLYWGIATA